MNRWHLLYIMETARQNILRNHARFIAANLVLGVAIAVAGIWSGVYFSFASQWENLNTVTCMAYLRKGLGHRDAKKIMDTTWKASLDSKWQFISPAQDRQENLALLGKLAPGTAAPKYISGTAYIKIHTRVRTPFDLRTLQDLINRLSSTPGVDFVVAPPLTGSGVGLTWVVGGMQAVGWVGIVLMFLVAVFLVAVGMRWSMRDNAVETEVIRYFGGTPAFYRAPVLIEGLTGGLIAGLVGFLLAWLGWELVTGVMWSTYSIDLGIRGAPIAVFAWIATGGPVGGLAAFFLARGKSGW